MWVKTGNLKWVNMRHMASLSVCRVEDEWYVRAYEVAEQSVYVLNSFGSKETANEYVVKLFESMKAGAEVFKG